MNKKLWDGLSKEDKALLTEAADKVMSDQAIAAEKDETEFKNKLEAAGVKVHEVTQAEWAESAKVVREKAWPRIQEELLGSILMEKVRAQATKISQ
jgi:TRAP-type C4-dicarboxylate transport system substrate-binding protein